MMRPLSNGVRLLPGLVASAVSLLAFAPLPARAGDEDRYTRAMRLLAEADTRFREGRLLEAGQGYLDLLRDFPTWWLPTLKSGVVARTLGRPPEEVESWIERARGLQPTGTYLPLVSGLLAPGVPRDPSRIEGMASPAVPDPLAARMGLLRAGRLAAQGRVAEAEAEYRSILSRTPAVQVARWRLARLLRDSGRRAEAAAILREGAARSSYPARWRMEAASMERSDAPKDPPK